MTLMENRRGDCIPIFSIKPPKHFRQDWKLRPKSKGPDYTASAYTRTNGVFGLWMAGGGDDSYGGAPLNPSNCVLYVLKNKHTWNKGIVFNAKSLTGTDGADAASGFGVAMEMARTHQIRWLKPNDLVGALIRSTVQNAGLGHIVSFNNNDLLFAQSSGKTSLRVTHIPSGVNGIGVVSSLTAAPVYVRAEGDDTDVRIFLMGKGVAGGALADGVGNPKVEVNVTGVKFFGGSPVAKQSVGAALSLVRMWRYANGS